MLHPTPQQKELQQDFSHGSPSDDPVYLIEENEMLPVQESADTNVQPPRALPRQGHRRTSLRVEQEPDNPIQTIIATREELRNLGLISLSPTAPLYNYAIYIQRLHSFHGTHHIFSDPRNLSRCGFYYAGYADVIRCFCCDGMLRNLSLEEDAYLLHASKFPNCWYIQLLLGPQHFEAVQNLADSTRAPLSNFHCLYEDENVGDIHPRHLCQSCKTHRASILFIPCGHLILCLYCISYVRMCASCGSLLRYLIKVSLAKR